jgi:hypothetical protein
MIGSAADRRGGLVGLSAAFIISNGLAIIAGLNEKAHSAFRNERH